MSGLQVGDVIHRFDRIRRCSPVSAEKLGRYQLSLPAHTGHPFSVAPAGSHGSRHVRAVIVHRAIVDRVVIAREIPAVDVIDIPVAVVIDPVNRIIGIRPDIAREIFMGPHHAFIDDPDIDA